MMGYAICSKCSNGFHYFSGRGTSLADVISPCCRVPAAKGKMLMVSDNGLTRKMKVFNIGGNLQFSAYPGKIELYEDEGDAVCFVPVHRVGRQAFYRIAKSELMKVNYEEDDDETAVA